MKKRVILSVTNDLTSEQRVHKVCLFLLRSGFDVTLVGRLRRKSLPLENRPYHTKRLFLLFEKGPLFYAEYNFRLFFYLLFRKGNILVANDLDTLLANFLAAKFKHAELVHDSHEYFTGVPELDGRSFAKGMWKKIERWIFPKLANVYTVNDSIANLYKEEYNVAITVVRNFPLLNQSSKHAARSKAELKIPADKKIILYQGSVNIDRGLIEMVEAMQYVPEAVLLIIGDGDIIDEVKLLSHQLNLNDRVVFKKRVPFLELKNYTALADIGISLDKDTNINYRFSLPNKIFDFIHSAVPVLASNLVEIKKVFSEYEIGVLAESHDPQYLADKINNMLLDEEKIRFWKNNCLIAAKEFCWENEEKALAVIYNRFL